MKETLARRIGREFIKEKFANGRYFELIVYPRHGDIKTDKGEIIAFQVWPNMFIGNGNIVVSTDRQEAIDMMKKVEPETDWSLFEIETFKDKYTVVYD